LFLLFSGLYLATVIWMVWDETRVRRPWKDIRARFNAIAAEMGQDTVPIEIEQVTNPDLGIVDRCQTCHPAIDRAGFESEDLPVEFRTHPRRKELLGKNHPVASLGCTICHHGQGPQTKGIGSRSFDHGRQDPYWERPLLSDQLVQSTCVQCHEQEFEVPGAPAFNQGRRLFEDLRCFGCHSTKAFEADYDAGPDLRYTREKHSPAFLEAWIRDPTEFRPDTRMPLFWPSPLEPESGATSPEGSERYADWRGLRDEEPRAIAAFLGSLEPAEPLAGRDPSAGFSDESVAAGKQLFDTVGCRGCHRLGTDSGDGDGSEPEASFGPQLDRQGEKASATWLAAWLADPKKIRPSTRMPNSRLTSNEIDRLTSYLVSVRNEGSPAASGRGWSRDEALIEEGRLAVVKYGCHGCHGIPGFEDTGKAGPDLDDFGSKTPDSLEWGHAPAPTNFATSLESWAPIKLSAPRRMERPGVELLMPDNELSEEEVEALGVMVTSGRKDWAPQRVRSRPDSDALALHEGERLIRRFNCRGCHEIGRDEIPEMDEDGELLEIHYVSHGGQVRRFYEDPALAPPPLTFAGEKFQYPWLRDFLTRPTAIRPWLTARMPTFDLDSEQIRGLIEYLAHKNEQPYPFESMETTDIQADELDDALQLFDNLQCLKCHQVSTMKALTPAERAPDLAISWTRLKPGWQRRWVLTPHLIQPGTKMPTLFPLEDDDIPDSCTTPYPDLLGGDVDDQIDALVTLTMRLGLDSELSRTLGKLNENRGKDP